MANPPPLPPGIGFMPDSETNLLRKIARNLYTRAVADGYVGIEPDALDDYMSSLRKIVYYTAYLAEN